MTMEINEHIPQTSASDRYEAARKALGAAAMYGVSPGMSAQREARMVLDLVDALRALITPPSVGESVEQIVDRWADRLRERGAIETLGEDAVFRSPDHHGQSVESFRQGVRAGIQSAHETWEPEVALRPTQEQMLRWLGIEYAQRAPGLIHISEQYVEKED